MDQQRKVVSPARSFKPAATSHTSKAGAPVLQTKRPSAPPVYVPPALKQFKPVSLLKKSAPAGPTPIQRQGLPVSPKRGKAPPVYRPQPPVGVSLQPRANHPSGFRPGSAPPVYRPQPAGALMQPKLSGNTCNVMTGGAPPVYRPQPSPVPAGRVQAGTIPGTRSAAGATPSPIMPASSFAARNTIQNRSFIAQPPKPNRYPAAPWTVSTHPRQPVIQPACSSLASCWSSFISLFTCCLPSPNEYRRLPDPTFDDTYGISDIRRQIEGRQSREKDTGWFTDTTCSTTAQRVTDSFATGAALASGNTHATLTKFMNGTGKNAQYGVVIHLKLQWTTGNMTQHEFVILQKGNECFLIQSWLKKFNLDDWFSSTEGQRKRPISEILAALKNVEDALTTKNARSINAELQNTFTVDEEESFLRLNWTNIPMEIAWEAWNQQAPS